MGGIIKEMIIVTGASQNHYRTLIQFVDSFLFHCGEDLNCSLIIYNLGIAEEDWIALQKRCMETGGDRISFRVFDFSLYPSYVNIEINAGEYAWKPIIIHDVCRERVATHPEDAGCVCWMDAGDMIVQNEFDKLEEFLRVHGIYSGFTAGNIAKWTHPLTLEYMECPTALLSAPNRNGAFLAFYCGFPWVLDFVGEFYRLALTKECIAPEGSSRENHRQDQAVFSVLFYQYQERYPIRSDMTFLRTLYTIHNDIE